VTRPAAGILTHRLPGDDACPDMKPAVLGSVRQEGPARSESWGGLPPITPCRESQDSPADCAISAVADRDSCHPGMGDRLRRAGGTRADPGAVRDPLDQFPDGLRGTAGAGGP
jgi:hypothetical protein